MAPHALSGQMRQGKKEATASAWSLIGPQRKFHCVSGVFRGRQPGAFLSKVCLNTRKPFADGCTVLHRKSFNPSPRFFPPRHVLCCPTLVCEYRQGLFKPLRLDQPVTGANHPGEKRVARLPFAHLGGAQNLSVL